jgi:D-alanyl-D-alanine carboxypeptidase
LEYLVSDLVKNDKTLKNCVLAVEKGDGSFGWSGAAGIARQDGQVPITKDSPIYIASITKLYTATVIMRMYEKGLLALDDPMSKYLSETLIKGIHVYNGKDYSNKITIKQLLSHTSGIADYYSEKSNNGKSLYDLFLEEPQRVWTVDETIERARWDLKPNFAPGTATSYSDTNFQLLGKIIESITQKPLYSTYEDYIFIPLKLRHTWLIGHQQSRIGPTPPPADVFYKDINIDRIRSNGSYWADGGIVSTAEEMIIFLRALNEGRIIKKGTLELMHDWHKLQFPLQYGYGTMYFKLPGIMEKVTGMSPMWGHSGSTASFLYYSKFNDLYLAGTLNQTESKTKPFILMLKVIKAIQSKKQV